MNSFRSILFRTALGASAGLLAGFTALAVAELVAGLFRPAAGPVTVVGGAVIDRTPAAVKDFAIRTFGENDKVVLQLGILVVLALIAAGLGVLALRHRRAGASGILLFGLVGAAAALSRPDAEGVVDALPSLVGAGAGAVLLCFLAGKATATAVSVGTGGGGWDRRGFLVLAGAGAVGATSTGLLGRYLTGRQGEGAVASRNALVLPAPSSPAPPVPRGAQLKAAGVTSFTTPNKDFYRVDTALVVPKVDAGTWRLRIHGTGVSRARTFTLEDLLARPLIERDVTLTCVSNEVGGPYAG
ncbi:molybdopterin-dependent oxidoreductase, partial [Streptomyces sp. NPDC000963]